LNSALDGITILDLTGMGPASLAAMMLGDMGADVLKVSIPPGVGSRGVGRGFPSKADQEGPAFNLEYLRNKKSIALNLKTEEGKRIFNELAKTADVILESFRPGVMDRLGVGYKDISGINPGIIFCSVTGYGQDGPYRDLPGHDPNYAGMGGALGLTGYSHDTPPVITQNIVADITAAVLQAVIGILLAICARERTGRGQMVDISMTDGVVFLLNGIPEASEYLRSGVVPRRGETVFSGTSPYFSVYQAKDGKYLTLCPMEPHFWRNMCQALGREDLVTRQFAQGPEKEDLYDELRGIVLTRDRDEWFEILAAADVPVGKVLDMDEVFSDPHFLHRQMLIEVDYPGRGKRREIGFSIKLSDTPAKVRNVTHYMGQHTDQLLTGLGYSREQIEKLREDKIIH